MRSMTRPMLHRMRASAHEYPRALGSIRFGFESAECDRMVERLCEHECQQRSGAARVHTELAARYYQARVAVAVQEAQIALDSDAGYVPGHTLLALIYAQLRQSHRPMHIFVRR